LSINKANIITEEKFLGTKTLIKNIVIY